MMAPDFPQWISLPLIHVIIWIAPFAIFLLNDLPRWLNNNKFQLISALHYPPSPWKDVPHHRGLRPLLFTNNGFFYVPQASEQWRAVRQGLRLFVVIREDKIFSPFPDFTAAKAVHSPQLFLTPLVQPTGRVWTLDFPLGRPALINWANRAAVVVFFFYVLGVFQRAPLIPMVSRPASFTLKAQFKLRTFPYGDTSTPVLQFSTVWYYWKCCFMSLKAI